MILYNINSSVSRDCQTPYSILQAHGAWENVFTHDLFRITLQPSYIYNNVALDKCMKVLSGGGGGGEEEDCLELLLILKIPTLDNVQDFLRGLSGAVRSWTMAE